MRLFLHSRHAALDAFVAIPLGSSDFIAICSLEGTTEPSVRSSFSDLCSLGVFPVPTSCLRYALRIGSNPKYADIFDGVNGFVTPQAYSGRDHPCNYVATDCQITVISSEDDAEAGGSLLRKALSEMLTLRGPPEVNSSSNNNKGEEEEEENRRFPKVPRVIRIATMGTLNVWNDDMAGHCVFLGGSAERRKISVIAAGDVRDMHAISKAAAAKAAAAEGGAYPLVAVFGSTVGEGLVRPSSTVPAGGGGGHEGEVASPVINTFAYVRADMVPYYLSFVVNSFVNSSRAVAFPSILSSSRRFVAASCSFVPLVVPTEISLRKITQKALGLGDAGDMWDSVNLSAASLLNLKSVTEAPIDLVEAFDLMHYQKTE